ncbi:hypothetical protein M153_3100031785 [Pseudoloma neurophilia]|uniref:Uncharacterized protein n=1 Tax=Pseudoloma neurophilia TaxID=146866 RepID=A0A0R0M877_9MICR|nr:hypothetical protein M153_3100031785 [Pseudoloma neurophilia]
MEKNSFLPKRAINYTFEIKRGKALFDIKILKQIIKKVYSVMKPKNLSENQNTTEKPSDKKVRDFVTDYNPNFPYFNDSPIMKIKTIEKKSNKE